MITRTSTQLLADLHDPANAQAWELVNRYYRPIVVGYARQRGLQDADAEDVAQETLDQFARSYRAGNFDRSRGTRLRSWLRGIASNRVKEFLRARAKIHEEQAPEAASETDFLARVPDSEAEETWDREWNDHVLQLCIEAARREFDEATVDAFELYAVKQKAAEEVAEQLGISRNAVYIAKSRVLGWLRELMADFDTEL